MIDQYYLYDDKNKIIYHGEELPANWGNLIYLGISNNPKPAMAGAVFLKNAAHPQGFRLKPMPV
jgi:hypothetical protein